MKLRSFVSRLQELNAQLEDFPPDLDGQESVPTFKRNNGQHLPFHANHVEKQDD